MPVLLFLLSLFVAADALAAASARPFTHLNTSVRGGERQVYSAQFLDATGAPSVGETVTFDNDACGTFDDGSFVATAKTDAQGMVSMGFTARPQGITCWINASAAPASVRFNVFTYTLAQVSLSASYPNDRTPGAPFVFDVAANTGIYPIWNADVTARVIAGTSTAQLAPGTGNTAQDGHYAFHVQPVAGAGDFEIEVGFKGITKRFKLRAPQAQLQDMWWAGASENGWGASVVQHGGQLFATLYVYDAKGAPTWFVMPGGSWIESRTAFTGALYSPHGTPFTAYDASRLQVGSSRGTARFAFNGTEAAVLDYEIDGVTGSKRLERQPFGISGTWPPEVVGDMWWGGETQNGWGVALLQQYGTLFGVWFTYDANGAPTWFVMPSGAWEDSTATTWEGHLYRTTASPWVGAAYDAAKLAAVDAGTFSIQFQGAKATFTYTIDGKVGTMALMRQAF